jgi:hypothetical protein
MLRVDRDTFHQAEVQHQSAFANGLAGEVVSAAVHRQQHAVIAGEVDTGRHIVGARTPRDQPGALVDHTVENFSGGVVTVRVGREQRSPKLAP